MFNLSNDVHLVPNSQKLDNHFAINQLIAFHAKYIIHKRPKKAFKNYYQEVVCTNTDFKECSFSNNLIINNLIIVFY